MLTTEPSAAPSTVSAAPKYDPTAALVAAAPAPAMTLLTVRPGAGGSATGAPAVAAAVRAPVPVGGGGPAGRGGYGYGSSVGGRRCAGSGALGRDGGGCGMAPVRGRATARTPSAAPDMNRSIPSDHLP